MAHKELEQEYRKYYIKNAKKFVNRFEATYNAFEAGWRAARMELNKEHLCSGCNDIMIENGQCHICNECKPQGKKDL